MNVDEVLAKMDALDASEEEIQYIIDENLRVISIPPLGVVLGVEGDKDVNSVKFKMVRYYKGIDLSKFEIRINFANANGDLSYYTVKNPTVTDDTLTFEWLVGYLVTKYKGTVRFVVRMITTDASTGEVQQAFDTTVGEARSLEGLLVDTPTDEKVYDIVAQLKADLTDHVNNLLETIPVDYSELTKKVEDNTLGISGLKEDVAKISKLDFSEFVPKWYVGDLGDQGEEVEDGMWRRTDYLNYDVLIGVPMEGKNLYASVYDSDKKWIQNISGTTVRKEYVLSDYNATYIRFVSRKNNFEGLKLYHSYELKDKITELDDKFNKVTIVNITGFGGNGEDSGVRYDGEIYYNPYKKLLRQASDNLTTYTTVDFSDNTVYFNYSDGKYYKWIPSVSNMLETEIPYVEVASLVNEKINSTKRNHTTYVSTVGGKIDKDGYIKSHINTDSDFFNYISTSQFIKYNNNIISIDNIGSATCNIYCYDETFKMIRNVSSVANIPSNTYYIKIEYAYSYPVERECQIMITHTGELEYVKNTTPSNGVAKFFSYDVTIGHYTNKIEESDNYSGDIQRYYDDAYIILPPNYNPLGEPVKLIIYTHGSDGYAFGETQPKYYSYQQAIAMDGFAICDCRALTNKYMSDDFYPESNNLDDGVTPLSVACYCKLYDYIVKNYNVRQDGCYMYGKSSGGLIPALFATLQPFKVRAIGCLAPMVSLFTDLNSSPNYAKMVRWQLEQYGYDMSKVSEDPTKEEVYEQIDMLSGYDPLLHNSNLDKSIYSNVISKNDFTDGEVALLSNGKYKYQNVPVKIWFADDDYNIRQGCIKLYKKLIDNANGICKLRKFSAGLGGHHAVDYAENSPKVDYVTKYGSTINMPVAYAELLDWFKQW